MARTLGAATLVADGNEFELRPGAMVLVFEALEVRFHEHPLIWL